MEDYKANSHRSKEEQNAIEKRKVEPVVKGTVKKKKNGVRKLTDTFISEDIHNVKSYVIIDVLIPAAKKAISDIVTNGIDMILYGETGRTKKRSNATYVSYDRFSDKRDDRRYSSRSRSMFDYDDLEFETREEAEAVLEGMDEIIDQYQVVSILDFYDLAGVTIDNPQADKYGWTNIRSARVERVRGGGYVIRMPRALVID